jgi:two-component system, OmpR family, response regulator
MNRTRHILVVDDQVSVRSALRAGLESAGFSVSEAADKEDVIARLEQQPAIDLVTLDLTLGHEDGLTFIRDIRVRRNVPIVMITARIEPVDRIVGLEHGADDYIVKPFHIREVCLRLQSVLRRYYPDDGVERSADSPSEIYECDAGIADVTRRELVTKPGCKVQLTDAEFDILVVFLRNPARVLSRDDLSRFTKGRAWSPQDRTLDGHVARLRKKIEPNLEEPRLIKTVWRVGYVFTGSVSKLA